MAVDGIMVRQGLAAEELATVAELVAFSGEAAMDLPALTEPDTVQVLYYEAGELLAAANAWLAEEAEIQGLVHPAYRRRGIGRRVLAAAQAAARARGARGCLLVCDEAIQAGPAFARALGAAYRMSEHRMQLDVNLATGWGSGALVVRQATAADAEGLVRILSAAFGSPAEALQRRFVPMLRRGDQRFLLGLLDGEPVGCLRLNPEGDAVYISTFGVLPAQQGRGYGRQLLQAAVATLLTEGREDIRLEVQTTNRHALALYEACGFRVVRTYGYYALPQGS